MSHPYPRNSPFNHSDSTITSSNSSGFPLEEEYDRHQPYPRRTTTRTSELHDKFPIEQPNQHNPRTNHYTKKQSAQKYPSRTDSAHPPRTVSFGQSTGPSTQVPARKPVPPRVAADRKLDRGVPTATRMEGCAPMPPPGTRIISRDAQGRFPSLGELEIGRIEPSRRAENNRSSSSSSSSAASAAIGPRPTSSSSNGPGTPTIRHRDSFKNLIRRASNEVAHVASLIVMDGTERTRWRREERDRLAREVEELRQQNPNLRPAYQRAYLSEKEAYASASRPNSANPSVYSSSSSIPSTPTTTIFNPTPAGPYSRMEPTTTDSTNQSRTSLTATDRYLAMDRTLAFQQNSCEADAALADSRLEPQLRKGEKLALNISETLDFVKNLGGRTPRKMSDDSDMDFTDAAPIGMMEGCERCGDEVQGKGFLKEGLCTRCYGRRVERKFE